MFIYSFICYNKIENTDLQEIIMVMMKLRLNVAAQDLGFRFGAIGIINSAHCQMYGRSRRVLFTHCKCFVLSWDAKQQFFRDRAGKIGVSISKQASHSNPAQPSISLIKTICYPNIFNFSNDATEHRCKHEATAIAAYEKW